MCASSEHGVHDVAFDRSGASAVPGDNRTAQWGEYGPANGARGKDTTGEHAWARDGRRAPMNSREAVETAPDARTLERAIASVPSGGSLLPQPLDPRFQPPDERGFFRRLVFQVSVGQPL
jgi:hypothetical protein